MSAMSLPSILDELAAVRAEMRTLKERDAELRAMVIEQSEAGLPWQDAHVSLPGGASLQAKPAERADLPRLRRALGPAAEQFITPGWHWRVILPPTRRAA